MKSSSALIILLAFVCGKAFAAGPMWEAGELHYPQDQSEVSAFINTKSNSQLQTVLCAKNTGYAYRFTLLLPKVCDNDIVIEVWVKSDTIKSRVYAEVSGNSLEFQVDQDLIISLTDSPQLTFEFEKDDAQYLGVPEILDVPMTGSDLTMRKVASECTALCINNSYQCSKPLVSSILWPVGGFKRESSDINYDALCTKVKGNNFVFLPNSESCRFALDRFFAHAGQGPLSFLDDIFNSKNSHFASYERLWNEAVSLVPGAGVLQDTRADASEWYLMLYSLIGSRSVSAFPQSYINIKNHEGDPTTFIYDTDSRYELETLKYSSVLLRRAQSSLSAQTKIEAALKEWSEFYREFSSSLPSIREAQALRPLIYRTMLLRIWRLAGMPEGVSFKHENAFVQGTNGKLSTDDHLEAVCSFFDGENGSEFFYGSDECIRGVKADLGSFGLKNDQYFAVIKAWDEFSQAWMSSDFYSDSVEDAVGVNPRSKLVLSLLSLYRTYGFGDYFLLRQCIASRDKDICDFENAHGLKTYETELETRLKAISLVSEQDANTLANLSKLWRNYYDALCEYVDTLQSTSAIAQWRASFVKGTALLIQTSALLNLNYDHEELPDESLEGGDVDLN